MAGIVESYKKVFENRNANIYIGLIILIWVILSSLYDIFLGNPYTFKQNPFDLVFNLFFGLYSLHFFNNAIKYNYSLPFIKELNWKNLGGMILLNIVWGFYLVLAFVGMFIIYLLTHSLVLAGIASVALIIISLPIYYIFIAFADDFKYCGLFNISLIFKFMNKQFYKNFVLFLLLTLAILLVYVFIYMLAALCSIDKLIPIARDYYLLDVIMYAFLAYALIVTWELAFPYSLKDSYMTKIRPIVKGEVNG